MADKKTENRNIDTAKARGELEEDLLEYVYRKWRQGRQITSKEYARTTGITGYEAAGLVRSLVTKGFLYELERRNPRFLAAEYEKLEHSAILRIKKSKNCFLLRTKKEESLGVVWYRREEEWIQAKKEKDVYQLPTDIFTYTVNTGVPITEAVAIIATTRFDQKPLQIDYRELNIHVW